MSYQKKTTYDRKQNKVNIKQYMKIATSEIYNRYQKYKNFLNSNRAKKILKNKTGQKNFDIELKEIWN